MTKEERFEKHCEEFDEMMSTLLLIHGYYDGCYNRFYDLIKADYKPTQRAVLKDLRNWYTQW